MRSHVNRGTPEQPGLVFALLPGGACRGRVFRLRPERAEEELERLWAREMPTGVYDARLLPCRTPQGTVAALAFTLSRRSEACLARLPDEELLHILRHARAATARRWNTWPRPPSRCAAAVCATARSSA